MFIRVCPAGPDRGQDDRESHQGRHVGGAAELSSRHVLDAQAGEDLRGGHPPGHHARELQALAHLLSLGQVPRLHTAERYVN